MRDVFHHRGLAALQVPTVALLASLPLLGCTVLGSLFGKSTPTTSLRAVAVIAAAEANRDSATALDVLFVYDSKVLPLLPPNGPAWFSRREGLANTLGASVDIVTLQVPPPYLLVRLDLPARYRHAIRVVAYANYLSPAGQAPIDLTSYANVTLTLQPDSIICSGT
jgi:type VI secretion system protein